MKSASLLDLINSDPILKPFLRPKCEDNGLCVAIDPNQDFSKVLIIKVDDFYNSNIEFKDAKGLMKAPPSIDCLIIIQCADERYMLYLVEQKNVEKPNRHIDRENLVSKFKTTLNDFLADRFRHHFYKAGFDYSIRLYLQVPQSARASSIDWLMGLTPLQWSGKRSQIMPLPSLIRAC